jgi:hypothetical protein
VKNSTKFHAIPVNLDIGYTVPHKKWLADLIKPWTEETKRYRERRKAYLEKRKANLTEKE